LRGQAGHRGHADARPADGFVLGVAQALALIPGISRYGATLTAGRARGFTRADAQRLSWHAALPVMLGASALKALQIGRGRLSGDSSVALGVGAGAAFASTLISSRMLRRRAGALRSLLPYSLYRVALAGLAVLRMRAQ
ncbi:MAG: undecaprenyl-diphosphate phosphatase, partial [Solirubrobacteraceae bacterium]